MSSHRSKCFLTSGQAECQLAQGRPGLVQPFMQPMALKNQIALNSKKTNLKFTPTGKNLVGGTQWTIVPQRPGLAQPLITAKAAAAVGLEGLGRMAWAPESSCDVYPKFSREWFTCSEKQSSGGVFW